MLIHLNRDFLQKEVSISEPLAHFMNDALTNQNLWNTIDGCSTKCDIVIGKVGRLGWLILQLFTLKKETSAVLETIYNYMYAISAFFSLHCTTPQ